MHSDDFVAIVSCLLKLYIVGDSDPIKSRQDCLSGFRGIFSFLSAATTRSSCCSQNAKAKKVIMFIRISAAVLLVLSLANSVVGEGRRRRRFKLTVRNLTPGQPMSPFFIAVHNDESPPFWQLSRPPPENGLREIAEDADTSVMEAFYNSQRSTFRTHILANDEPQAVGPAGLLVAGEESSIEILTTRRFPYVSMVSMAVNTNDCFVGFAGRKLEDGMTIMSPGYDAGTEINDEDCANIPGPACMGGAGKPGNGEGYVVVHNGVHGIGGLQPSEYTWNNNMLLVEVEEV